MGWCNSYLDSIIWYGEVSDLGAKTAFECWDSCSAAHPDIVEPRHEFWNDGQRTWCVCQDGCTCMEDVGKTSTLAPPYWSPPNTCGTSCSQQFLVQRFPENVCEKGNGTNKNKFLNDNLVVLLSQRTSLGAHFRYIN